MKKIGILTFHGADNFGCVLQCMALQNAVKTLYPDSKVEVINYMMPNLAEKRLVMGIDQYRDIKKKFGTKTAVSRIWENLRTLPGRMARMRKFRSFRKRELNLSGDPFMDENALQALDYDVCIVGSDQVWNRGLVKEKEKIFYLEGMRTGTKKISYAASTGHSWFGEQELEWFQKHISNMDAISIREKSALSSIQGVSKKEVAVCLDPTMLHDKAYWRSFERKPRGMGNEKYVFMYGLGYAFCKEQEAEACRLAKDIADKEGLKVVHSYYGAYRKRFDDSAKHCYYQGPYEFLWLVDHAEYVINCSYHGTVFSVIFQKPFYTYSTAGNSARMTDLVETLGIEDRYLDKALAADRVDWNINWDLVDRNWKRERQKSLMYLKEAIGEQEVGLVKE